MRAFFLSLFCLASFFPADTHTGDDYLKIQFEGHAQGTTWHITYFNSDTVVAKSQIDSILDKIDSSMSLYKPYSLISQFNNSLKGIVIDGHFRKVVEKSLDTYSRTGGLFDITVQPLVEAWGFSARKPEQYPDSAAVRVLLECLGSRELRLKGSFLTKKRPCIKIDLDGIAQGYTVDVLADFLEENGIRNYLVEVGGEIRVQGRKQPGNLKMTVGIEAPGEDPGDGSAPGPIQKILTMDSGGITTSGNYHVYHESAGKKFSHIIDPRTGYPSQNELISVTVFSANALTSDAYDNALMIMGLKDALSFVEKRKDLAAYFIYRKKDGTIGDSSSRRFPTLVKPE